MSEPSRTCRLFLARHGRTEWNAARRRAGREDVPLDAVGRAQAERLRDLLAGESVDVVFASPLQRARDTATPLAHGRGLEVRVDPDLIELDFGDYSGTSRDVKLKLRRDYVDTPVPGGESLREVWQRAERFVARRVAEVADGAQILVVGHHRLNRLLLGVLRGRTLEQTLADQDYRPANGSVIAVEVRIEGGAVQATDEAPHVLV